MSKTNILAVGVSNGSVFEAKIKVSNKRRYGFFKIRHLISDRRFSSKSTSLYPNAKIMDCLPAADLKERRPFQTLCAKARHIAVVQGKAIVEPALVVAADNRIICANSAAQACFRIGVSLTPIPDGVNSLFAPVPFSISFLKKWPSLCRRRIIPGDNLARSGGHLAILKNIALQKDRRVRPGKNGALDGKRSGISAFHGENAEKYSFLRKTHLNER